MTILDSDLRNGLLEDPLAEVAKLIDSGLLQIAQQPKNNQLELDSRTLKRLYVFLIDHDYPGGSAAMHNAVFDRYDLSYRSCFMIGDPAFVEDIIAGLRHCPIYFGGGAGSGFKDKIAPALDALAPSAQAIGSVNVIERYENRLVGHNTDGVGFVAGLLSEYPNCIAGKKIVILGAGGTALPITYELAKCGPRQVVIINRTIAKAELIAELIRPMTDARAVGEAELGNELADADLVVNTSNKGAQPNEKFSAFAAMTGDEWGDLAQSMTNLKRLPKSAIVADILLEDMPLTLKLAREAGNPTHSGRHMNLYQAAPALKILTGLDESDETLLEVMSKAVA
ncbi:putative Shikimate dehydrogenase [Crenothrix polyspora]|uniref:shikimate dehydrogenase (NADP(+)) n=1 Tax=Crenothrix polyspora TaxID=360316 RepID=A0A1R4HDB1_9GAMM|nr:hypothetical protein [Crenothrix polyspora]SJM93860.1 putative Shikimate dehydrogenase [Crenothrix polyspora]